MTNRIPRRGCSISSPPAPSAAPPLFPLHFPEKSLRAPAAQRVMIEAFEEGNMSLELDRRSFLKTAALSVGPAVIGARGANDKLQYRLDRCGNPRLRRPGLAAHAAAGDDVRITAICDTYQGYIARAKDRLKTIWGNTPAGLQRLPRTAGRQDHRRGLHHDARAPASRYGHRRSRRPASTSTSKSLWPTPSRKASTLSAPGRSPARSCQVGTQNRSSSLYKKSQGTGAIRA